MDIMMIPIFILLLYLVIITGSIALVIWAIIARLKEKKEEKDKLDKYKKY